MTPWMQTSITVEGALKLDIKDWLLNDPQNEHTQMWLKFCGGVWQIPAHELFDPKWLGDFEKLTDLKVDAGLVFYRAGGYQHPGAHIDVEPLAGKIYPVSASFNWVLDNDTESAMTWYKPWWDADDAQQSFAAAQGHLPHPDVPTSAGEKHAAMLYQETPLHLLKETHCHSLSNTHLTLVRTNVPHNVRMGPADRWAVTLRSWASLPETWSECVQRYAALERCV